MEKKKPDELLESLYSFVKDEFKSVHTKLDRIEGATVGHENRISALEDWMRFIKTKLGFN
jgi:hypothetical protein